MIARESLFCRQSLSSFDKQLQLAQTVGRHGWQFNMSSGMLSFGAEFKWKSQILGTESNAPGTWLWAWANEASNIPPNLLGATKTMRFYGEHHQIPEFTAPEFALGEVDGHTLAMIATGICRANAYYRASYEGGAAYLLIQDENFPVCREPPLARLVSVFPQAISSIEISDHRLALIGYLDYHGVGFEEAGRQFVVKEGDEEMLTATFDEQNRLTNLEARIDSPDSSSETAPVTKGR